MNRIKQLIKTSFIYFVGNVSSKLLSFLLIPLYTSYISTSDYGEYDIIVSVMSLFVPIIFFQVWDAIFRFTYDYEKKDDKYKIVTNGLVVGFISIILYECIIFLSTFFINIPYFWLVNAYGITVALQYIFGIVARTFKENKLYMYSGVINTVVNLLINLILILCFKLNNIGTLLFSVTIGNIIQCLLIGFELNIIKNIKYKYVSKKLIIKMIKFSALIGIATVSYWLLSGYTKIVINKMLGSSYNGIFAVANKFSSAVIMVVSVLQMAWQEVSFESANQKDRTLFYEKGLNCLMVMLSYATIIILMIIKLFFNILVKGDYIEAYFLIPIVIVYSAINSFSGFSSSQFFVEKNSNVALYTTLISAVLNIIIVKLLIMKFKLIGAAISLLISFSLNAVLRSMVLFKKYKIKTYLKSIIISLLFYIISVYLYYNSSVSEYILFAILSTSVLFWVYKNMLLSFIKQFKKC